MTNGPYIITRAQSHRFWTGESETAAMVRNMRGAMKPAPSIDGNGLFALACFAAAIASFIITLSA